MSNATDATGAVRSMTGFGQAEGAIGANEAQLELRTVNHRFFSPSIKLPSACAKWETDVRELLRSRITRGHATLSLRLARAGRDEVAIDEARFATAVAQLRALHAQHALDGPLDLATVLRMPNVLSSNPEEAVSGTVDELLRLVREALDALDRARLEEGHRLTAVLHTRIDAIADAVTRIAARAPARLEAQRQRLRRAVQELADGVDVDDQRLAQELAILADRLDISEEIDRFHSHLTAFRETLAAPGGVPVGKRLGFLLQELLREANTTGSKAADAEILQDVIGIKEELERIREQVENLE